jgi:hypothetical protein
MHDKENLKLKFKNTNEEIYFRCSIQRQTELVFLLLLFLKHTVDHLQENVHKEKNLNVTYSKSENKNIEEIKKMIDKMKLVKNFR